MTPYFLQAAFGPAADCRSVKEIVALLEEHAGDALLRRRAGAYGLALAASAAVTGAERYEDSRRVLDEMAQAKARIDAAAWHALEVARATAAVLWAAQAWLEGQTIANTEWPTPQELANVALEAAEDAAAGQPPA